MAKLHSNRLIFTVETGITISVCVDKVYKVLNKAKLFEHGMTDSSWQLEDQSEITSVDMLLFGGA